ncbi:MAG: hypothetical protein AB1593_09985, partial [Pseudomonadota bacterium]
ENNLHSLNRYAYANNNPYKFTDPDGQAAETVIDVVSLGLSINAYRQDPGFVNGLAVAYDGFATAIPFLPGGIGIIRQAASKGETLTQVVKQAADRGAAKAGESAAKNGVHRNSLGYVGETHVYRIKGPDGKTHKIGESAQGTRKGDGASIRGEQQARKLTRESGEFYRSEVRKTFPDKASARDYETRVIERFRRIHGDNTLPGNKTNR